MHLSPQRASACQGAGGAGRDRSSGGCHPNGGGALFWAYNSGRVEANVARVRAFLSTPGPQVLRIDEPAAEQFGRLKAILRREGRLIGDIDVFIAGVALCHGLTVVTNNISHFERIPELPLENWLEPPQASS